MPLKRLCLALGFFSALVISGCKAEQDFGELAQDHFWSEWGPFNTSFLRLESDDPVINGASIAFSVKGGCEDKARDCWLAIPVIDSSELALAFEHACQPVYALPKQREQNLVVLLFYKEMSAGLQRALSLAEGCMEVELVDLS